MFETTCTLRKLLGAEFSDRSSAKITAIAYQTHSIGSPVLLDVLDYVSLWHPRTDDGKREQGLGNSKEG